MKFLAPAEQLCTRTPLIKLWSGALKRHIHAIHEGRKEYQCINCTRSFARSDDLQKHIFTLHDNRSDYECDFCEKIFTRADSLHRHHRTVHKGLKRPLRDHRCGFCRRSFAKIDSLDRHMETFHEFAKDKKCDLWKIIFRIKRTN